MGRIISSLAAFASDIGRAAAVELSAYTLGPGRVRNALVAAASGGAAVRVRLEGAPFDDPRGRVAAVNAATIALLRAAGADAAPAPPEGAPLHLKAALIDGVAWLDDRNWASGGASTLIRDDDSADVAAVRAALYGTPPSGTAPAAARPVHAARIRSAEDGDPPALAVTKADALRAEAALLAASRGPVLLESESFGPGPVADALAGRARAGDDVRVVVAGGPAARGGAASPEMRTLRALTAAGVRVRLGVPGSGDAAEKLAITASGAWVGSANATSAGTGNGQSDWGLVMREPAAAAQLAAHVEAAWRSGRRSA